MACYQRYHCYLLTSIYLPDPVSPGLLYKHHSHWFIHKIILRWFSSKSSKHYKSQTVKARELNFWENVYPIKHFTCHMSSVTCDMSCIMCHSACVMCHMSCATCHNWVLLLFWTKWWSLPRGLLSTGPTPFSFVKRGRKSSAYVCESLCPVQNTWSNI